MIQRVAVVSGASRGLGKQTAVELERRGLVVIPAARGSKAWPLDVTDPLSVAELAERIAGLYGRVDVLVNNAGVALDGFDPSVLARTLAVNYYGAVEVAEAFRPLLSEGGAVVNVSSGLGALSSLSTQLAERFMTLESRQAIETLLAELDALVREGKHTARGWPSSAYNVSKAALNAYTRVLAKELAPARIRVNAVCPGWVRTAMGGRGADRSVEEGAEGIVWAAMLDASGPTGGFFRDGRPIPW